LSVDDPYESPKSIISSESDQSATQGTTHNEYEGLGGWLILVGLGIVVSPIRIIAQVYPSYSAIFSDGTFTALSTPGNESYNMTLAMIIIGEIAINIGLMLAWLYIAFLFFTKKRIFPRWYIGILVFTLVFIIIDALVFKLLLPGGLMFDPATIKEIMRSTIALFIWGTYTLVSKRVKATFVR